MSDEKKKISIVVPVFNESEVIDHFYNAIVDAMNTVDYNWELIMVDDGSKDGSDAILHSLSEKDRRVRPLILAKNYGHQAALTCGLDHADGDAVITMDGDMQHPPALLPQLISYWEQGYEVVQTIRETTEGVSVFKKFTSDLYYRILNSISEVYVQPGGSDFRLMDHQVVVAFRRYRERDRFIRGMIGSLGFKQCKFSFVAPPRFAGQSKFSPKKMLKLAVNGIMSNSIKPLKIGIYIGFVFLAISAILFISLMPQFFMTDSDADVWKLVSLFGCFFSGIQLITLGVIGEYIGHIFKEVKRRPLYLLRDDPDLDKY